MQSTASWNREHCDAGEDEPDTITLTSTDDGEAYDFVIVYEGDGHEDHDCDVCGEPILMGYVSESGQQAYCCVCIVDKFLAPA